MASTKNRSCSLCAKPLLATQNRTFYACAKSHAAHTACAMASVLCPLCERADFETPAPGKQRTVTQVIGQARLQPLRQYVQLLKRSRRQGAEPVSVAEALNRSCLVQRCCAKGAPGFIDPEGSVSLPLEDHPWCGTEEELDRLCRELIDGNNRYEMHSFYECFTGSSAALNRLGAAADEEEEEEDDDDDKESAELQRSTHRLHEHVNRLTRDKHLLSVFHMLRSKVSVQELRQLRVTFNDLCLAFSELLLDNDRAPTLLELHDTLGYTVGDLISLGATWENLVSCGLAEAVVDERRAEVAPIVEFISQAGSEHSRGRKLFVMIVQDLFDDDFSRLLQAPFTAQDYLSMSMSPEALCESTYLGAGTYEAWAAVGRRMTPMQFICEWGWSATQTDMLVQRSVFSEHREKSFQLRLTHFFQNTMRWRREDVQRAFKSNKKPATA